MESRVVVQELQERIEPQLESNVFTIVDIDENANELYWIVDGVKYEVRWTIEDGEVDIGVALMLSTFTNHKEQRIENHIGSCLLSNETRMRELIQLASDAVFELSENDLHTVRKQPGVSTIIEWNLPNTVADWD